ncbi:MAG: transposase [Myxococcales bacterium]|nr:transposase [Myxococcales bacterium]
MSPSLFSFRGSACHRFDVRPRLGEIWIQLLEPGELLVGGEAANGAQPALGEVAGADTAQTAHIVLDGRVEFVEPEDLIDPRSSHPEPPSECRLVNTSGLDQTSELVCEAHCLASQQDQLLRLGFDIPLNTLYGYWNVALDIYKIEAIAKKEMLAPEERHALRQERSIPLLSSFHEWALDIKPRLGKSSKLASLDEARWT